MVLAHFAAIEHGVECGNFIYSDRWDIQNFCNLSTQHSNWILYMDVSVGATGWLATHVGTYIGIVIHHNRKYAD